MSDETAQKMEQAAQAPRSVSLTDGDRRLLAALLDELVGTTNNGRRPAEPRDAGESSRDGDAARATSLASGAR
jgi:hypothetical protein